MWATIKKSRKSTLYRRQEAGEQETGQETRGQEAGKQEEVGHPGCKLTGSVV
jgi:hypothetical protein